MSDLEVFVSIINWNNSVSTKACINSVINSSYLNLEIVVIDNASIDNSVNEIKAAYPNIRIVELPSNEGYAGGHRHIIPLAIEAQADLILLLNNDLLLQSDTITKLIEAYLEHGEGIYGAVPVKTFPESDDANQQIRFPKKFLELPYRERIFDFNPYVAHSTIFGDIQCKPIAAVPGSLMLIPVEVVQNHGFMDERFFMYSEEIEYCFRLRDEGIPSYLVSDAFVVHSESESSRKNAHVSDLIWYYRIRNQLIRIIRYESMSIVLLALIKNIFLMIGKTLGGHPMASYYIFRGIIDGFKRRLGKTYAPEKYL